MDSPVKHRSYQQNISFKPRLNKWFYHKTLRLGYYSIQFPIIHIRLGQIPHLTRVSHSLSARVRAGAVSRPLRQFYWDISILIASVHTRPMLMSPLPVHLIVFHSTSVTFCGRIMRHPGSILWRRPRSGTQPWASTDRILSLQPSVIFTRRDRSHFATTSDAILSRMVIKISITTGM